jgi:hypothetical protein
VEIVLVRGKNSTTNTTEMTSEVLVMITRALIHMYKYYTEMRKDGPGSLTPTGKELRFG